MVQDEDVLKTLSVVIPVLNEEENIPSLIESLKAALDRLGMGYEILFVDDGSTDNTFALLKELHEKDSYIKVIKLRRNFGQTAALSSGFDHAQGDIVVTMDGDLQNDPDDIPTLIEKIEEGYDVVSGWRSNRKDPFLTKRLPSKFSNWLACKLTGLDLHDFGCTLKAYTKESLGDIKLYGEMHRYIPAVIDWRGFRVSEVKVRHRPREYGKTKYNIWRLTKGFLDLINIKFWAQYSTRPLHFFGIMGLVGFLTGLALGIYLAVEKFAFGHGIADRPLLLLAILLVIAGVQSLTMGLLGELVVRTYHETQNKPTYVIKEILE